MVHKYLNAINSNEIAAVVGGLCQCICNRKIDGTELHNIGKAKSLEECSKICLANGWKLEKCDNISKKEKDET